MWKSLSFLFQEHNFKSVIISLMILCFHPCAHLIYNPCRESFSHELHLGYVSVRVYVEQSSAHTLNNLWLPSFLTTCSERYSPMHSGGISFVENKLILLLEAFLGHSSALIYLKIELIITCLLCLYTMYSWAAISDRYNVRLRVGLNA